MRRRAPDEQGHGNDGQQRTQPVADSVALPFGKQLLALNAHGARESDLWPSMTASSPIIGATGSGRIAVLRLRQAGHVPAAHRLSPRWKGLFDYARQHQNQLARKRPAMVTLGPGHQQSVWCGFAQLTVAFGGRSRVAGQRSSPTQPLHAAKVETRIKSQNAQCGTGPGLFRRCA